MISVRFEIEFTLERRLTEMRDAVAVVVVVVVVVVVIVVVVVVVVTVVAALVVVVVFEVLGLVIAENRLKWSNELKIFKGRLPTLPPPTSHSTKRKREVE